MNTAVLLGPSWAADLFELSWDEARRRCAFVLDERTTVLAGREYKVVLRDQRRVAVRVDGISYEQGAAVCRASWRPLPEPPVMVIEDDDDVRDEIADAIARSGATVVPATNGLEALQKLARAPELPRLILLDLMMPVMDGWQFRQAQRDQQRLKDIPVVAITAGDLIERPIDVGVLPKPIDLSKLIGTVNGPYGLAAPPAL